MALVGDLSRHTGPSRSIGYRWFTDPSARDLYPTEDHEFYSRMYVSGLRGVLTRRGPASRAADWCSCSTPPGVPCAVAGARGRHPTEGDQALSASRRRALELSCQVLLDPEQSHSLLVYTAAPGSESHEKLQLLAVVGAPTTG